MQEGGCSQMAVSRSATRELNKHIGVSIYSAGQACGVFARPKHKDGESRYKVKTRVVIMGRVARTLHTPPLLEREADLAIPVWKYRLG